MADKGFIRLSSKVLKDLNISIGTAVGFLKTKDIEVEASVNTKISREAYDILCVEFDKDRSKKIASREITHKKKEEKQEILKKEALNRDVIAGKSSERINFKHVGNISIDGGKQSNNADSAMNKKQQKVANSTNKPSRNKKGLISNTSSKGAKKHVKDSAKKNVPKSADDKTTPKKPMKTIRKALIKKTPESAVKPSSNKGKGKKVEEERPVEVLKTSYHKLEGIKNTGKVIDLKSFEKPKRPKQDRNRDKNKNRRRRPRIKKDANVNNNQSQGNNNRRGGKGVNRNRFGKKRELTEQQVQKQVTDTLARLQGKKQKSKGSKYRREKRDSHRRQAVRDLSQQVAQSKVIKVAEFATAAEIVSMMNDPSITVANVISSCMSLGLMISVNQRLDKETITLLAEDFGYQVSFEGVDLEQNVETIVDKEEDLMPRYPIVTVMGHVDHGKTSLLDYIRETNVIAGESGGITQHIGAYNVKIDDDQRITFFDTPGHEAFTAMRARGTQLTDIAVIVIAADGDIMPQTNEAISHAQAAGVPIVFAINKIDKPNAQPEKIKEKLAGMNLLVEDWGGKIQSQDISAKKGTGVSELLEKILLEADVMELKANPNRLAEATVVEATLKRGSGYVTTVLVNAGTLKVGDYILAGQYSGKVRAMFDERGNRMKQAGPSIPVSLLGLDGAPQSGDKVRVFEEEREAKKIAIRRAQLQREQSVRTQKQLTLDEVGKRIAMGGFSKLDIILKGDVDGSVEALTGSLQKLSKDNVQINIIHKAVGAITESDVQLAAASSDSIIIGFNVRPAKGVKQLADKEGIEIKTYSIIFEVVDDVTKAMEGMLSPEIKEEVIGEVEIRVVYKISKVGNIAGCMVTKGKVTRNSSVRLIREGIVVHDGRILALKRFKDDAKEVQKGYECGIQLQGYNNISEGDLLEIYESVTVRKKV